VTINIFSGEKGQLLKTIPLYANKGENEITIQLDNTIRSNKMFVVQISQGNISESQKVLIAQ